MTTLVHLLDRYARIGVKDIPKSRRSRRYAFNALCLLGGLNSVPLGLFSMAWGGWNYWPLGALCLVFLLMLLTPLVTRRNEFLGIVYSQSLMIAVFSCATWLTGAPAGVYLFLLLGLINALILRAVDHPLEVAGLTLLVGFVIVMNYLLFPEHAGVMDVDVVFQKILFIAVLVAMVTMEFTVIFALTQQVATSAAALEAEHARSETLLHNLLPEDIAARLKERPGEIIADGLPAVTLLFADIENFTPRAARMAPEQVIAFLNGIFSAFDRMTDERGLEKIKTIGDAYMVAAGLPVARKDHAAVIADMALEMLAETHRLSTEFGEDVRVRIGLHSGPAIAGVIGTRKLFYDVWGDTVNTASRMESHGEPGRIQTTTATRALLLDRFNFEPRGPVEIKGLGRIETFWLTGRR